MKDNGNSKILGGIVLGAGSIIAGKIIKDKIDKNYIDKFLRRCSDFERDAKNILVTKGVRMDRRATFNDILHVLDSKSLLDRAEISKLFKIRNMRNKVVHGNQDALSKTYSVELCSDLKNILKALS